MRSHQGAEPKREPRAAVVSNVVEKVVDNLVAGERLSTDYLNHYNEALMLIEMSILDPMMAAELVHWQPKSYVEHFTGTGSSLRCAQGALNAWHALDPIAQGAFTAMCMAMDRMVTMAIMSVEEVPDPFAAVPILEVAAEAFRLLHARATTFINNDGHLGDFGYAAPPDGQSAIDDLMAA